ncbi:hypothetical protein PV08_02484 [Exophiala spinifera]|uniref:Uncharacterized protein n=1 Tax=Exophiala spinifera TaxID=91928 RepID=A0A0D1YSG5_9EURO|nr:uncharacterized protein PV08_02484 [Exophiala spinifera]KIW18196.1 hypothetical protein PV08_02484 [Exophiala spinifera]
MPWTPSSTHFSASATVWDPLEDDGARQSAAGELAVRAEDLLHAHRRHGDGERQLAAHDLGRQVRKRTRRDQPTGHGAPFLERRAILACRLAGARVAHEVPFAVGRQTFRGQRFPVQQLEREGRSLVLEALLVHGSPGSP